MNCLLVQSPSVILATCHNFVKFKCVLLNSQWYLLVNGQIHVFERTHWVAPSKLLQTVKLRLDPFGFVWKWGAANFNGWFTPKSTTILGIHHFESNPFINPPFLLFKFLFYMVYMTKILIVWKTWYIKPYFICAFVCRKIMQHSNPKEDAEEQNPTKYIKIYPHFATISSKSPQFVGKSTVFQ